MDQPASSDAAILATAEMLMGRLRCVAPSEAPVIFSAPHNVGLARDGFPDHKPEDYTSFLANEFANAVGGGALAWSRREIEVNFVRYPPTHIRTLFPLLHSLSVQRLK